MHLPRIFALLTAVALFGTAAGLRAQDGDGDGDASKAEGRVIVEEDGGGMDPDELKEKREAMKAAAAGAPPTAASGLERYVQAIVSVDPVRIAPGAGGTLKVSLGLREGAVIAANGDLRVTVVPEQGPLRFGPAEISPPTIASQSKVFMGQPAWESYAIATLPVVVAAGTPFGKYQLIVRVEASVSDPDTGELIGRFMMSPRGEVAVGPPMATPAPRAATAGGSTSAAGGTGGTDQPRAGLTGNGDEIDRPRSGGSGAGLEPVEPVGPGATERDREDVLDSMPPSEGEGGFVWILAGAAGLVLALVAFGALKRR